MSTGRLVAVGPGEGLHNDQKLRFVQRRVVNGGNA